MDGHNHDVGDTSPVDEQWKERYKLVAVVMHLMIAYHTVARRHFQKRGFRVVERTGCSN